MKPRAVKIDLETDEPEPRPAPTGYASDLSPELREVLHMLEAFAQAKPPPSGR